MSTLTGQAGGGPPTIVDSNWQICDTDACDYKCMPTNINCGEDTDGDGEIDMEDTTSDGCKDGLGVHYAAVAQTRDLLAECEQWASNQSDVQVQCREYSLYDQEDTCSCVPLGTDGPYIMCNYCKSGACGPLCTDTSTGEGDECESYGGVTDAADCSCSRCPVGESFNEDLNRCCGRADTACFCAVNPGSDSCCTNDCGAGVSFCDNDSGSNNCGNGMCCFSCERDDTVWESCRDDCGDDFTVGTDDYRSCLYGDGDGNAPGGGAPCDQDGDLYTCASGSGGDDGGDDDGDTGDTGLPDLCPFCESSYCEFCQ
ncbi:MAG: hypothetical protein O2904_04985, partial [bacterium]|nr:hypothetical protein [bacterium]